MNASPGSADARSTGHLLKFFVPLAVSWLFMATEMPISVAIVSRLPDPAVNTAAFLLMGSLALWIESPVIDLLASATTLARDRQALSTIKRFVWMVIAWVTVLHAIVAIPPVFRFVAGDVIHAPKLVVDAAQSAFWIMIPWSGLIGWRRFMQGVLIRNGRTKAVGAGTFVRVITMFVCGFGLYFFTSLAGIIIVAISLTTAVAAEASFAHLIARRTIRENYDLQPEPKLAENAPKPLTIRKLAGFHFPLTASTIITLTAIPITSAALARSPDSILAMAAWQVCTSLLFLHRAITFSLPEVVITLLGQGYSRQRLKSFCISVGLWMSGLIAGFGLLGLDRWFFGSVLNALPPVAAMAHLAYWCGLLLPLLNAMMSYIRGMLTAEHKTVARLRAIAAGVAGLLFMLYLGVQLRWPGVVVGSVALTVGHLLELWVLAVSWRKAKPTEPAPVFASA